MPNLINSIYFRQFIYLLNVLAMCWCMFAILNTKLQLLLGCI